MEKHLVALNENVEEVDRLISIHQQLTPKGPGRKFNVQILHKSSIVLLVACWEAFIEDLAAAALEEMIRKGKDHTVFPSDVLKYVAQQQSGMNAWKLAGLGWKKVLRGHYRHILGKTVGSLNTPKSHNVDDLFKKTLGLKSISSAWYWSNRTIESSRKTIDDLVTLRGSIAHRVTTARSVTLNNVATARGLVFRLSVKSHNRVRAHLVQRLGESAWSLARFGGTL